MIRYIHGRIFTILLLAFMILGCTSVNYIGETLDPTTKIDTYFSSQDIDREYTVIGHALGLGLIVGVHKVEAKLIEEARIKGADAILITKLDKGEVLVSAGSTMAEHQVAALYLKYK